MNALEDVVLVLGITLFCGAPLFMALFIFHEILYDNWGKECRLCHTTIYSNGCQCGRSPARGPRP